MEEEVLPQVSVTQYPDNSWLHQNFWNIGDFGVGDVSVVRWLLI